MSLPYLVDALFDQKDSSPIIPKFPNWERSFVSGPESPLYLVEHRISNSDSNLLFTLTQFKPKAEGPPGHVHGGASAGLIDEVMGVVVWNSNHYCVTENLSLHYGRPIPLNEPAMIATKAVAFHEKTIEVHSTIRHLDGTPYVTAKGIFHRLSQAQLEKFKVHRK